MDEAFVGYEAWAVFIAVVVSCLISIACVVAVGTKWGNFVAKHIDLGNTRAAITVCGIIVISSIPWILAYLLGVIYV